MERHQWKQCVLSWVVTLYIPVDTVDIGCVQGRILFGRDGTSQDANQCPDLKPFRSQLTQRPMALRDEVVTYTAVLQAHLQKPTTLQGEI